MAFLVHTIWQAKLEVLLFWFFFFFFFGGGGCVVWVFINNIQYTSTYFNPNAMEKLKFSVCKTRCSLKQAYEIKVRQKWRWKFFSGFQGFTNLIKGLGKKKPTTQSSQPSLLFSEIWIHTTLYSSQTHKPLKCRIPKCNNEAWMLNLVN